MELTAQIQENKVDYKSISSPPGGILLWILILLEMFTFGIALAGLVYYRMQEPELFGESKVMLNTFLGSLNTVILLSSGFFMASAIHFFKKQNVSLGVSFMVATIITGCTFIAIKWYEYSEKIEMGLGVEENMFFTFYWLLTCFHLIHVVVGLAILLIILLKIKNSKTPTKIEDIEAGAAFWHMCDLIWLLLFPALYLVF